MKKKFFKQHFESGSSEWTIYGCYDESDITPNGGIRCLVDDVENDPDLGHIRHTIYENYCEPDEVTHITKEEYNAVIKKLRKADGYCDKCGELLKSLI